MVGQLLTERHIELLTHWRSLIRPGNPMPFREDFDPVEIPGLLSFIALAEVDGDKLRFRVVGTDMVRAWKSDFTGQTLDEILSGAYHTQIKSLFDTCIETGDPLVCEGRFQWHLGRSLRTCRLLLPLACAEFPDRVAYVLLAQSFDYSVAGPKTPIIRTISPEEMSSLAGTTTPCHAFSDGG